MLLEVTTDLQALTEEVCQQDVIHQPYKEVLRPQEEALQPGAAMQALEMLTLVLEDLQLVEIEILHQEVLPLITEEQHLHRTEVLDHRLQEAVVDPLLLEVQDQEVLAADLPQKEVINI
jgi:hypothetical protein